MGTEPMTSRRRWQLAAAAVVVLLLAGGGVALALRPSPTPPGASAGSSSPAPSSSSTPAASPSTSATSPSPTTDASPSPSASATSSAAPGDDGSARPSAPPVPLDEPATPRAGVDVRLASIEKVEGLATIPGEVGGPSLRITVEVRNDTAEAVSLTSAVTNLYMGPDRVPAIGLMSPGASPLPTSVAPGASATGVWVFNVPEDQRSQVAVEFDLAVDSQVVLFEGPVS